MVLLSPFPDESHPVSLNFASRGTPGEGGSYSTPSGPLAAALREQRLS